MRVAGRRESGESEGNRKIKRNYTSEAGGGKAGGQRRREAEAKDADERSAVQSREDDNEILMRFHMSCSLDVVAVVPHVVHVLAYAFMAHEHTLVQLPSSSPLTTQPLSPPQAMYLHKRPAFSTQRASGHASCHRLMVA